MAEKIITNIKDKKTFLKSYKKIWERIKVYEEQKESIEIYMNQCCRSHITGMPRGHDMKDLSNFIVQISEVKDEIDNLLKELTSKRIYIETCISKIIDPDEANIIRKRYIQFKEWEEISQEIGYCERQIYRIHGKALINIIL